MYSTLLPMYIIANSLFRGLLRFSYEAQRCVTVDCTAILVVFDLAYTYLLSTANVNRLLYRCTIINSTLYRIFTNSIVRQTGCNRKSGNRRLLVDYTGA